MWIVPHVACDYEVDAADVFGVSQAPDFDPCTRAYFLMVILLTPNSAAKEATVSFGRVFMSLSSLRTSRSPSFSGLPGFGAAARLPRAL